ncbi:hypothetical protein [Geotalea toluenoxydans]|uniref:hypothetical protein n=1 Tax=Geotalea toluenoxydans TaxID=421624 RepID=UPI0006CF214F|nr:hypothetical protein [Geotalea toluenoxydans]
MKTTKNFSNFGLVLIAYLLGCLTFYVFVCFTGVVKAFLWDKGFESAIVRTLIKHLPKGDARSQAYIAYSDFEYIVVNFLVVFLFVYFLSKLFENRLLIYSVILTIGAVTADFYYFKKFPFDLSLLLGTSDKTFQSAIWFICTILSIKISSYLKAKRAQPALRP